MNHQINIDEAIAIAKEYHLETEVTECIKQGMSPEDASFLTKIILKVKIMKTRKHFIRKYELLARCIQTNLELFILQ